MHRETIEVANAPAEILEVRETRWGPIAHDEDDGSALALRWTAQQAGSLDFGLLDLASAADLDAALRAVRAVGVPAQNMLLGDTSGRIAWRLVGRIPARVGGCDPQAPCARWRAATGAAGIRPMPPYSLSCSTHRAAACGRRMPA